MIRTKKVKLPVKIKIDGSKMSIAGNIMLIREPLQIACDFYQVQKRWNKEKKHMEINLGYTNPRKFVDKFKNNIAYQ